MGLLVQGLRFPVGGGAGEYLYVRLKQKGDSGRLRSKYGLCKTCLVEACHQKLPFNKFRASQAHMGASNFVPEWALA